MSRSSATPDAVVARYPRSASWIGAVLFAFPTYVLFDALFIGAVPSSNLPAPGKMGYFPILSFRGILASLIIYAFFLGFGFCFLVCYKTMMAPSLMFRADPDGVTLGKGVMRNQRFHLPWSAVAQIGTGEISYRAGDRSKKMPALKLVFHQPHGMGRSGLNWAHPSGENIFVVGHTFFRQSLDETIALLERWRQGPHPEG